MNYNHAAVGIPAELRQLKQWVVWKTEPRKGKPTKVPYRPDHPRVRAETDDPGTWGTFEQACSVPDVDGIGFVFSADDPYCGVDMDRCIDPDTGEIHPAAASIIRRLGSYTERSPARPGVHVIVKAKLNGTRSLTHDTPWGDEFAVYDQRRFFTMTGHQLGDSSLADRQQQLDAVVAEFLPAKAKATAKVTAGTPLLGDQELLAKAFAAKNGTTVQALWNTPADPDNPNVDDSADDLRLCNHLAFYTGPDPDRLDRLFRGSSRMRDKWDEVHHADGRTYGQMTIDKALDGRTEFYTGNGHRPTADSNGNGSNGYDPVGIINAAWGITGHNPVVSGQKLRIHAASADAIVLLHREQGQKIRFESVTDLWEPRKHHRFVKLLVSGSSLNHVPTQKKASEIAAAIIDLCGGDEIDPLEEGGMWVGEFIVSAAMTIDGTGLDEFARLKAHKDAELNRNAYDLERPVLLRVGPELWLPAGDLKRASGCHLPWWRFDNQLLDIGWSKKKVDVRAPTTREDKPEAERIARNFYVSEGLFYGTDVPAV